MFLIQDWKTYHSCSGVCVVVKTDHEILTFLIYNDIFLNMLFPVRTQSFFVFFFGGGGGCCFVFASLIMEAWTEWQKYFIFSVSLSPATWSLWSFHTEGKWFSKLWVFVSLAQWFSNFSIATEAPHSVTRIQEGWGDILNSNA